MDTKKRGNYLLYIFPGYGIYDQFFKKHKGERSALGIVGSSIWTAGFIIKMSLVPAYIGKGVSTGDWHPFRFDSKDKVEQVIKEESDKEKNLEKIINYEEAFR